MLICKKIMAINNQLPNISQLVRIVQLNVIEVHKGNKVMKSAAIALLLVTSLEILTLWKLPLTNPI